MKELILASGNSGKLRELQSLLHPIHCIAQTTLHIPSVEETGLSFIENALLKARHASLIAKKPALADDSGLVVPALEGAPGIYSARYAGLEATDKDNLLLLLNNMAHLPSQQRQAYFYCAIALVQHAKDPTPLISTGLVQGHIAMEASGDKGFGYDPIFFLDQYQCTMAQLSDEIKNKISHRAIALAQLKQQIQDLL